MTERLAARTRVPMMLIGAVLCVLLVITPLAVEKTHAFEEGHDHGCLYVLDCSSSPVAADLTAVNTGAVLLISAWLFSRTVSVGATRLSSVAPGVPNRPPIARS